MLLIFGNSTFADVKALAASQAAERIINVLEHKTFQRHLTTDLINIARNGHLLSEPEKERLKNLGFDFSGNLVVLKSSRSQYTHDTQHFRFHYDLTGNNSVDPTDTEPANGIPDYVDTMGEVFEEVYDHSINELGYVPPPSDGTHGGNALYDVIIIYTNAYGYTNYIDSTWGDNPNSTSIVENNAYASYINMRNSYAGFADNSELESIQVTAAHEFFHAIQLGYDGDEELWMLEATAVWMEEEHYDDVNDCYQYLIPRFEKPHYSIRSISGLLPYGSFILFKYIDEHLGGKDVIRRAWEYSREYNSLQNDFSIEEIDQALKEKGHSFKKALTNMAIANLILSDEQSAGIYSYEEAQGYHDYLEYSIHDTVGIELTVFDTINFIPDTTIIDTSNRILQPYAAQYFKINTNEPVRLQLREFVEPDGTYNSIDDLNMHSIRKTIDGNYFIDSGKIIDIDPKNDTESLYLAIVSMDTDENTNSLFNYRIIATDGKLDNIRQFGVISLYPYPFKNTITIKINVVKTQVIDINIYDLLGRKIRKLVSRNFDVGYHELIWDGKSNSGKQVSSGVYFISLKGENSQEWKKVTLIK